MARAPTPINDAGNDIERCFFFYHSEMPQQATSRQKLSSPFEPCQKKSIDHCIRETTQKSYGGGNWC
jgi:hypothetical protein